jgi:hypothetical protein
MKVKSLIEALQKFDPELEVGQAVFAPYMPLMVTPDPKLEPIPGCPLGQIYDLDRYISGHTFAGAQVQANWASEEDGEVEVTLVKEFKMFGVHLRRGLKFRINKKYLSLKSPSAPV